MNNHNEYSKMATWHQLVCRAVVTFIFGTTLAGGQASMIFVFVVRKMMTDNNKPWYETSRNIKCTGKSVSRLVSAAMAVYCSWIIATILQPASSSTVLSTIRPEQTSPEM